jgi:putative methionine-R-sulfoxide reductase with GAF domain
VIDVDSVDLASFDKVDQVWLEKILGQFFTTQPIQNLNY